MPAAPNPLDVVNTVARNLVPVGGVLFLGWSAPTVLVLYFADTMFAMTVMFAGLAHHFIPPPKDDGWAARMNGEAGAVGAAVFITVFLAVPLGVPLIFMLAGSNVSLATLFGDPAFRAGLVLQAIAAFWSGVGLYRALRTQTPEQLRLKRRFALVFLRWLAMLMVTYTGITLLFGRFAAYLYVALYAGLSVFTDIAPDKFLRLMPGGAEDADSLPSAKSPTASLKIGARDNRKR